MRVEVRPARLRGPGFDSRHLHQAFASRPRRPTTACGVSFLVGDAFACGYGRISGVRLHKSCEKPRGPTSPRDCWAHRQCGPDPCRSVPTDGPLKETKREALQKDADRNTPARSVAASVRRCISGAGRWVGGVKDASRVATKRIPSPSRPARPLNSLALRGTGGTP